LNDSPRIEDDEMLDLLQSTSNEMLAPLVEFICKKGRPTSNLQQTKNYRRYAPDHGKYLRAIAAEIQRYGANDFASFFRGGKGVQYSEIVRGVARKLGVKQRSKNTKKRSFMLKP
jgi:hypothetical protein